MLQNAHKHTSNAHIPGNAEHIRAGSLIRLPYTSSVQWVVPIHCLMFQLSNNIPLVWAPANNTTNTSTSAPMLHHTYIPYSQIRVWLDNGNPIIYHTSCNIECSIVYALHCYANISVCFMLSRLRGLRRIDVAHAVQIFRFVFDNQYISILLFAIWLNRDDVRMMIVFFNVKSCWNIEINWYYRNYSIMSFAERWSDESDWYWKRIEKQLKDTTKQLL